MHKYKISLIKRGYIAIYVLLAVSLCLSLAAYTFSVEVRRAKAVKSYISSVTSDNKFDEYKEYAFTYMSQQVNSSVSSLSYYNVKQWMQANGFKNIFDSGRACIEYDESNNKILLKTYYDSDYYRQDMYDYKISDNKLRYIYLSTKYIKGRLQ